MKGSERTWTHTVWLSVSQYLRNFVLEYFKDSNIFGYSCLIYKVAVCMYTIAEVLLCIFFKKIYL